MIGKFADRANPAVELSRHFCRNELFPPGSAMETVAEFELNFARHERLNTLVVNNWLKCRTGFLIKPGLAPATGAAPTGIAIEVDIHTRDEPGVAFLQTEQLRDFYGFLPQMFTRRLDSLFSGASE
jgi:hypothetical protein